MTYVDLVANMLLSAFVRQKKSIEQVPEYLIFFMLLRVINLL